MPLLIRVNDLILGIYLKNHKYSGKSFETFKESLSDNIALLVYGDFYLSLALKSFIKRKQQWIQNAE